MFMSVGRARVSSLISLIMCSIVENIVVMLPFLLLKGRHKMGETRLDLFENVNNL